MVGVSVVLAGAGIVLVMALGPTELAAHLTEPRILFVVLVTNALVAVFRVLCAIHAWSLGGGQGAIVVIPLTVVVLAPHAAVGYVGFETGRTLDTIFAAPTATTTTTATTSTTTTSLHGSEDPVTTTTSTTVPSTTTTAVQPEDLRLNVLLLGGDAGPGRSGLRTDSVIVASVDEATGDAALFSIPRNWGGLELADGTVVPDRIVNEVYEWARSHPERFAGIDPGATALVEVAEVLTGLDIDYFALVDLTGFAAVIDALGGVTIDVPRSVYGPAYDPDTGGYTMIRIPRGRQELTGTEALAYVRERYQSSDYDRMRRQRCVLASLAAEADLVSLLRGIREILDAMEHHVTTDVPRDAVPLLIRTAAEIDHIHVVGFDNRWRQGWDARGFAVPDPERVRETVAEALENPNADEVFDIDDATTACG